MLSCPNKRLKIWKDLVKAVGEPKAYVVWGANNGMVEEYLQSVLKPIQTNIEAKKADIERRRQEELNEEYEGRRAATFSRFNPDGPNQELTKEEHDEIEELIEAAIEHGNVTAEQLYKMIRAEGYIYTAYGSQTSTLAYLKNRLSGKTKTKAGGDLLDETNAKYDAELDALEGKTASDIEAKKDNKKEEDLKNRLQELKSQLPTPGLEMPKTIDDTVLFELRKVYSMRANKRPQAEKKLLETYGPERVARAKYIEENFQKIVEGIVSKKINFFYDKDSGKFERCP